MQAELHEQRRLRKLLQTRLKPAEREAIKRLATQEGYALTLVKEDHERGSGPFGFS